MLDKLSLQHRLQGGLAYGALVAGTILLQGTVPASPQTPSQNGPARSNSVSNKTASTLDYMAIWSRVSPNIFIDRSISQTLIRSVFCAEYSYARDEFQKRELVDAMFSRIQAATANAPDTLTDISITYPLGEYDFSSSDFPIKAGNVQIRKLGVTSEACWPRQTPLFYVPEAIAFLPEAGQLPDLFPLPRDVARDLVRNGRPSYRITFDLSITGATNTTIGWQPTLALKGRIFNVKSEIVGSDGKVLDVPTPQISEPVAMPTKPEKQSLPTMPAQADTTDCSKTKLDSLSSDAKRESDISIKHINDKNTVAACQQSLTTLKAFDAFKDRLTQCRTKITDPEKLIRDAASAADVTRSFIEICKSKNVYNQSDSVLKKADYGKWVILDLGEQPSAKGATVGRYMIIQNLERKEGNPYHFTNKIGYMCVGNTIATHFDTLTKIEKPMLYMNDPEAPLPLKTDPIIPNRNTVMLSEKASFALFSEFLKFEADNKKHNRSSGYAEITTDPMRTGVNVQIDGLQAAYQQAFPGCRYKAKR